MAIRKHTMLEIRFQTGWKADAVNCLFSTAAVSVCGLRQTEGPINGNRTRMT